MPLQVHLTEHDTWSEIEVAQALAQSIDDAIVYVYPGSAHLFTDASLPEFDAHATQQVMQRTLALLDRVET